ncbi:EI24 domain-containing protein [Massilia aurea]|uniref:EI24 domain-containing protein n=1 Tax=Massilia aurea TaxID=373040 RepID=UPI00351D432D
MPHADSANVIPGTAPMKGVLLAWRRALRAQFSGRMLLLSLVPLLLSLTLWGVAMWSGLQPLLDWLHGLFADYGGFDTSNSMLGMLGLGMLKVMVVPLLAIALLLPLMIASSLLFMGIVAMPAIERHVSGRHFPKLEKKEGGSFIGSLAINLGSSAAFALLWLFTLPLYAVPPLAWLVQASLWAWVTSRVMSYDALAAHASPAERQALMRRCRPALLAIGLASGLAGALPGIAWMGGALISVVLFPVLALVSLWLYIMIFLFAGLWFQYYCLQALEEWRAPQVIPRPQSDTFM